MEPLPPIIDLFPSQDEFRISEASIPDFQSAQVPPSSDEDEIGQNLVAKPPKKRATENSRARQSERWVAQKKIKHDYVFVDSLDSKAYIAALDVLAEFGSSIAKNTSAIMKENEHVINSMIYFVRHYDKIERKTSPFDLRLARKCWG